MLVEDPFDVHDKARALSFLNKIFILMKKFFLTWSEKCNDFEVLVTQRETNLLE